MKKYTHKVSKVRFIANLLIRLKHYKHLIDSRRALAKLNDDMLKDIGISKAEANNEATKAFWQSDKKLEFNSKVKKRTLKQSHPFTKIRSKLIKN